MAVFVHGERLFVLLVLEDDPCLVVAGVSWLELAGEQGRDVERFAGRFAMIMGAMAEGQEAEAVDDGKGYGAGVAVATLKPAKGACAATGQDDAFVIGFPQDGVDALGFPDRDHIEGTAASYDDGVHAQ